MLLDGEDADEFGDVDECERDVGVAAVVERKGTDVYSRLIYCAEDCRETGVVQNLCDDSSCE